jgi:iron complex transport system substrate-binding protein
VKPRALLAAAAALTLLMAAAGVVTAAPDTRTVRDDTHLEVTVAADSCRIISLAPGTTAMLYAVGAGKCLVGTIAHSKEPAEAAALTVVGDAETLDFEQLLTLRPSVVVVAVDVVQRVRIDRIRALGIPVYQVHVKRVAGMTESLRRLGQLTNTGAVAEASAARLDADLARIAATYRGRANLRVLYQIWDQPIYTIGGEHVITDALQLCGATNVFAELSTAAPAVTREAAVLRNPDLILVSAPPESAAGWIAEWRRIPTLRAVQAAKLVAYADERMDRMGPSLVDATEGLCKVIDAARPR